MNGNFVYQFRVIGLNKMNLIGDDNRILMIDQY